MIFEDESQKILIESTKKLFDEYVQKKNYDMANMCADGLCRFYLEGVKFYSDLICGMKIALDKREEQDLSDKELTISFIEKMEKGLNKINNEWREMIDIQETYWSKK